MSPCEFLANVHLKREGDKHRIAIKDRCGGVCVCTVYMFARWCEHQEAHLSEDSAGCFSPFITPPLWACSGNRGERKKSKVRYMEGGGGERSVAEVSRTAAAAQLSGGRRGHFSLPRHSLQCRRQPRLRGRTDRLKYWRCRGRQSEGQRLSFGKLVASLSCNGFIYSHLHA